MAVGGALVARQDSPTPPVPSSTTTRRITLSNDARAVPTGAAEPSSITTIIASNLDPGDMSYTWTSVNVPQGWYILTASLPERAYSVNSQSFFVHPGSSTACLPVATSSSSTSSTPSGSPSPTTTTIPVGASSSSVSIGTIVGISIGAVALVAAILAARPSVPDSVIGRRSIDSTNAYPPSSPSSPSNLRNSSTPALISRNNSLRTQQPSPAPWTNTNVVQSPICPSSPASPSDATKQTKQANRQSFGARKRKPVPAYDASLADEAAAAPPPVPPHHELVHKSSFGPGGIEGKPMHYLIPDMPMSAKD
ncbi:unnamed protein product [Cyclocybe aegerita]|uniref:Uncharacterized protein n=1 Tax=Cyclocybe aegerita TaxID=1973307 RepID=A0A8S0XSD2_CYCAE|nr:unnamed protein product [Cyclocybe aegerita]